MHRVPIFVFAFSLALPSSGDSAARFAELQTAFESKTLSAKDALADPRWRDLHDVDAFRDLLRQHAPATRATLAPPTEEGEPLVITGRVLDEEGRPIMDALVYAYHTDRNGLYSDPTPARPGGDNERPRIRGLVRTGFDGRFEFRTIRPGGYPNGGAAQHVHFDVDAVGFTRRRTEILFDDDPRLDAAARASAERSRYVISKVTRDAAGVQRVAGDFVLERVPEPRFAEIRRAIADGKATVAAALVDPRYEDLHPDTRFRDLMREHAAAAATAPLAIAFAGEPGTPLVATALVRDAAGAPVPGALVYAYQTDARGWNAKDRPHCFGGDPQHARLFGYVRSGDDGRFTIRTIRPAGYPKSTLPQHIHVEIAADGFAPRVTELLFENDPRLTTEGRARAERAGFVVSAVETDEDSVERATYEIVLDRP